MNPKETLIDAFKNDPRVERFRALETEIERHPTLLQAYEDLKVAQQIMVRAEANKTPGFKEKKADYDAKLEALKSNPFIEEYLDLIEELNYDLQWTMGEIESQINAALHPKLDEED